jgi:hypothetical protein
MVRKNFDRTERTRSRATPKLDPKKVQKPKFSKKNTEHSSSYPDKEGMKWLRQEAKKNI